ncbi:MAG: ATP-grasp domain-containing protein [Chloroflexota bacterium]
MANIAVYVERYTISHSREMGALMHYAQVAQRLGHRLDVLFRPDIWKIPRYDSLFIRSLTDPLNAAYVASETGALNGLRVIDDPDSIIICCDKVNMYRHLEVAGVPIPATRVLSREDISLETGERLLKDLGKPVVLKAANSSFSMFVEKVESPEEFVKVGRRFLRRSNRIVAQRFVRSEFDWRVGVLAGEPLYVCKYIIPKKHWKIHHYDEAGRQVAVADVQGYRLRQVPTKLLQTAVDACHAIGRGLYGVDLKQVGDEFVVIEVNDNPTIAEEEEDQKAPELYERIVRYLAGEWG